ncbi:MAG: lysozyme inhibitor LprI family protein [Ferruginibacter sp.]
MIIKQAVCILFLCSVCFAGSAQTVATVNDLAAKHQQCLDAGIDMTGCSRGFCAQMDSMLNVVYNNFRTKLNVSGKEVLKKEQIAWLKKRDAYYKNQDKIYQDNIKSKKWGPDMQMVTYDDKADFIKARVLALIKRMYQTG